jgi:hypothetical protein
MPATCVRTTRPATAGELATLRERGKARGMVGCLAAGAVPVAVAALVVGLKLGLLFGLGVVVLVLVVVALFAHSFLQYHRPIRARQREDEAQATVEVLAIAAAEPIEIPPMHSSVSPAFAIELEGGRTLLLLGQWLSEEATFGGTPSDREGWDDDAGDAFGNALPPPFSFPTRDFTVHRFPISGEVLRIELTGPYVHPPELDLDLRAVNDAPSRIFDVVPSKLVEALPPAR